MKFLQTFILTTAILFFNTSHHTNLFAQNAKQTISGTIRDAATGETLIAATIFCQTSKTGSISNEYGFYSITIPNQDVEVVYSYIGYKPLKKIVAINQKEKINVDLEPANRTLSEVQITGEASVQEQIKSTQTSVSKITAKEAKILPALFGEVDIIKTLQLKPGVKNGGEGSAGLYVRGGGNDQNLIILDEATVYNASHLFGFFSTFNPDAVKDVELYTGGFPAKFGGRLSSVVDIKMNDGNRKKFSGTGGVGLIASRLTLEGPISKNEKGSFIFSGRRTYVDAITNQINKATASGENPTNIPPYYFYDLNTKINYDLGDKDKLFLSGYFGRDVFQFRQANVFNANFNWGNATGTLRWNHIINSKLFVNTSLIYSNYDYTIANKLESIDFKFELGSNIEDQSAKVDFTFLPNENHTIKFGTQGIYHHFKIGRLSFGTTADRFESGKNIYASELGFYASDDWKVSNRLKLNYGMRLSGFGDKQKFYTNIEPRLAANIELKKNVALKFSYARMVQYINLIANSGTSLPTDIWYPANANIKPQTSDQIVGGISINIGDKYLLSNEIYYKWLANQVDVKDGGQIFGKENLDGELTFGRGWGYGNEIYLEKKQGTLTGWIGYTLSWSWRQFDQGDEFQVINEGKPFHPRYDRRHDISIVAIYKVAKRLNATATWVYGTGNAFTFAAGQFIGSDIGGTGGFQFTPVTKNRNDLRQAPYHRLDLGLVWLFKPKKYWDGDLTFSVYNAYSRLNPYFIFVDVQQNPQGQITSLKPKQVSLFPIIPTFTYNFKF